MSMSPNSNQALPTCWTPRRLVVGSDHQL